MQRHYRYSEQGNANVPKNTPWLSLTAMAILMGIGLVIVVSGQAGRDGGKILLGVVVANIPGALAAVFAERTSRDVRNGTVVEKVRQGTVKAIDEKHVSTTDGPAATAALGALQVLLTDHHKRFAQTKEGETDDTKDKG